MLNLIRKVNVKLIMISHKNSLFFSDGKKDPFGKFKNADKKNDLLKDKKK
jgi:hypothetical protein